MTKIQKVEKDEPKAKFQGLLETILDRYYVTGYIEARAMNGLEAEIIGIFNQMALESSPTSKTTMEEIDDLREQIASLPRKNIKSGFRSEYYVYLPHVLGILNDKRLKLLDAANPARRETESES